MYKSIYSILTTLFVCVGFLLCISLSSNYFIGCRDPWGCKKFLQAPEEWIFGIPVIYYGVLSYLVLVFTVGMKIWGSPKIKKISFYIGACVCGISTVVNFALLTKLWVEHTHLCHVCVFSALIYLILTYLYIQLLVHTKGYYVNSNERFVFLFGAIFVVGCFTFQHSLITYKENFIIPLAYETLVPEPQRCRGEINSKIKVIVFTDLCCLECRESYVDLQKIYKASYPHLSYGIRYFPKNDIMSQSLSMQVSLFSLCMAEEDKYWEFLENITNRKQDIINTPKELIKLAKIYGIKKNDYLFRIQTPRHSQILKKDLLMGKQLKLNITPTYFIYSEGRTYIANAHNFKKVLSDVLGTL